MSNSIGRLYSETAFGDCIPMHKREHDGMDMFLSGMLVKHPTSPKSSVECIRFTLTHVRPRTLRVGFDLIGDMTGVVLPPCAPSQRRDGLWTATCFELFARAAGDNAYLEWNFAPDTAWAAYAFNGYRSAMRNAESVAPVIERDGAHLTATAELSILPVDVPWRIGLSAVIRHIDGNASYWALTHPPGKPDFHHPDCFAIELAPSP